jgi:hypothetical protein
MLLFSFSLNDISFELIKVISTDAGLYFSDLYLSVSKGIASGFRLDL